MTDVEGRIRRYTWQLLRFAHSAPTSEECFLHTLQNTAYLVIVTDGMRLLVHAATQARLEVGDVRGGVVPSGAPEAPTVVRIRDSIEKALFPGARIASGPAGITISSRWTVLSGLAFSSPAFAKRHWSDVAFYRHCAEDIPFRVTADGDLLGINLLYGWEEDGEPRSRVLEVVREFGSQSMLPIDDAGIEDLAWNDFAHGFRGRGAKDPTWSFAAFLKSLEAPADETVLLLGSYKSDATLSQTASALTGLGYRPIMLRDAPDLPFQTNTEKFLAGVMCSAFVVVVDTEPSGHLGELTHLLNLRLRPVIILRHEASPASWFQEDRVTTDDLCRVVVESSFTSRNLAEHVRWARAAVADRVKKLNAVNHWRSPAT